MNYLYESISPTRLYIKECSHCSMKYFGKTVSKNIESYRGSGKRWTRHLKKHNANSVHVWNSDWYYDTSISRFALKFSRLNRIVESKQWANMKEEDGLIGGWSHVHQEQIQLRARENRNKTVQEKYGVKSALLLPHAIQANKDKVPWNRGKTGAFKHDSDAKKKMSIAASNRVQSEHTKNNIRNGVVEYYKNKGIQYVFIDGLLTEDVGCLKQWCNDKGLDYHRVYRYIDTGPVQENPRYKSDTRSWFLGKEIRRKLVVPCGFEPQSATL
jgi:hypothetical protein